MNIEKLKEWFNSEQGKKSINDFFNEIYRINNIEKKQLEKFHLKYKNKHKFNEFVEKVITKYNSKEYRNRWYNKGCEPEEALYSFLLKYAEMYGRKCNRNEWIEFGNSFTHELYFINGYYFNLMLGQGSCVQIIKKQK